MWTVQERVDRGAQLLDEQVPGWKTLIDVNKLNIASCRSCILGQIWGDYVDGTEALGLDADFECKSYGFDFGREDEDIELLNAEWTKILTK